MEMLPITIEKLNEIRDECKSMVTGRATLSAGAATVPIPGADIAADIPILLELIKSINKKFGLSAEQIDNSSAERKSFILATATTVGSELIGTALTKQVITKLLKKVGIRVATKSVAKYVPFLGSALAASISFGAMKMLGNSHVDDCYEVAKRAMLEHNAAGA
jgi:uncharacterized protein (DUF697 family)